MNSPRIIFMGTPEFALPTLERLVEEYSVVGVVTQRGVGEVKESHITDQVAQMEAMIEEESDIVQVIDPDDPLFYNPASMKEAFNAFFQKTGQILPDTFSDYIRCAYDSLCFSFRFHVEELERLSGKGIEILHLVGGGSQSDYLNQRIATICGRKVISGPVEGATLGNILVQALAMGRISSLQEGRELVKRSYPGKTYFPEEVPDGTEKRYKQFLGLKDIQS